MLHTTLNAGMQLLKWQDVVYLALIKSGHKQRSLIVNEERKRGRGRPPGTTDEPERLIRQELVAHLKAYRRIRELIERRVETEHSQMNIDELGKAADLLRKGISEMARSIVAPAKPEGSKGRGEEQSVEEILAEITGGQA